jgi:hypothetical protein
LGGIKKSSRPYLLHFACFACRRSHKRALRADELTKVCPTCGGAAIRLGRHFKAPAKDDQAQWRKVRFLVAHGFLFQHVYETRHGGLQVPYPETVEDAREFVRRFRDQACATALPEIQEALSPRSERRADSARR